jgi:multidrug efflux system outer membrane protein
MRHGPGWHGCRLRGALVACLAVAACLAGCKVGPDFVRPAAPWLEAVYHDATPAEPPVEPELAYWWTQFNDPMLNELIDQAACENLTLQEAYFRVVEARALVSIARGDLFPEVFGTGGYSRKQTSLNANQFVIPPTLRRSYDLFSTGFDAGWEIDLWGKLRRTVEAAEYDLSASEAARRDVLVTLLGDVGATYIEFRVAQQRMNIARLNLKRQQTTAEFVRERFRAGLVSELDIAQAEQNVHTTAATIPALEQQTHLAAHRLSVLLGESPSAGLIMRLGVGPVPTAPQALAVGVPADLLRRRPDVRQAEFLVAAQNARIGVAIADLYPQLSLRGTITADSRNVSNWFAPESLAYSMGPQFRWDILNFGRLRGNIRLQEARWQQTVLNYRQSVLIAVEEVENALITHRTSNQRRQELYLAVQAATDAMEMSESQYEQGLVIFQVVLDSQRDVFDLQEQMVVSQGAMSVSTVQAFKAAGGGWDAQFSCCAPQNGRLPATVPVEMTPGEMVPASPPREVLPPAAQVMPMMAGAAGAVRR